MRDAAQRARCGRREAPDSRRRRGLAPRQPHGDEDAARDGDGKGERLQQEPREARPIEAVRGPWTPRARWIEGAPQRAAREDERDGREEKKDAQDEGPAGARHARTGPT